MPKRPKVFFEESDEPLIFGIGWVSELVNEEIKRRTHVVRIFPNGESCLRLVRALAVETHENWLEQHRYLNMDDLSEHKKEALRRAA